MSASRSSGDEFEVDSYPKSDERLKEDDEKKEDAPSAVDAPTIDGMSSPELKYSSFHEISSTIRVKSPLNEAMNQPQAVYRVTYRGVVSLLESPHVSAERSGHYLSYGEIFTSNPTESESNGFIRVHRILTGGYAMDATIDRRNSSAGAAAVGALSSQKNAIFSPVPEDRMDLIGYILVGQVGSDIEDATLVERLSDPPTYEQGRFVYRITAASPVPVLVGPSSDAPKTQAFLLPNTVHEVSLRLQHDKVWFLRLSHRRGWIVDTRITQQGSETVVKEVRQGSTIDSAHDVDQQSVHSHYTTPSIDSRWSRKHRPPRRKRDVSKDQLSSHDPSSSVDISVSSEIGGRTTADFSNVSLLSEDPSFDRDSSSLPNSPDVSYTTQSTNKSASSVTKTSSSASEFFLMRVTAPKGLKVLDAPQFQVNNLVRNRDQVSSSHQVTQFEGKLQQSIFQTMSASRIPVSNRPSTNNAAVFDTSSRGRVLPCGVLFEASRRLESTPSFTQGAGLIRLSDGSGWAVVPQRHELESQMRLARQASQTSMNPSALTGYEEVGRAFVESDNKASSGVWLRVVSRAGVAVACAPPVAPTHDGAVSPASSKGSSTYLGSTYAADSDVASSVGSGFLDAMFRTRSPSKKKESCSSSLDLPTRRRVSSQPTSIGTIACGTCIEVESWGESVSISGDQAPDGVDTPPAYVRLCGGQGWIPLTSGNRIVAARVRKPDIRQGSFWFRVQCEVGIKVRRGPSSMKASSIKSESGVYFRFECGEFLRASEVLTVFAEDGRPKESYAKLFRNRHARLHDHSVNYRSFESLSMPAEWVCIYFDGELFLEECHDEPRIERHRQGWRYNVVPDAGVEVRQGPSFAAKCTGITLLGGESVLISERVTSAGENMVWLRIKEGDGWIHDTDPNGMQIMLAHSLRNRVSGKKTIRSASDKDEVAYNTIIARLFHNKDDRNEGLRPPRSMKR